MAYNFGFPDYYASRPLSAITMPRLHTMINRTYLRDDETLLFHRAQLALEAALHPTLDPNQSKRFIRMAEHTYATLGERALLGVDAATAIAYARFPAFLDAPTTVKGSEGQKQASSRTVELIEFYRGVERTDDLDRYKVGVGVITELLVMGALINAGLQAHQSWPRQDESHKLRVGPKYAWDNTARSDGEQTPKGVFHIQVKTKLTPTIQEQYSPKILVVGAHDLLEKSGLARSDYDLFDLARGCYAPTETIEADTKEVLGVFTDALLIQLREHGHSLPSDGHIMRPYFSANPTVRRAA